MSETAEPARLVVHGDAFAWLDAHPAQPGMSVVTSLPDVSELSHLDLQAWRAWFIATVVRVIQWLPPRGVAVFYQSDVRARGYWVDKGYLVLRGAEDAGASVLWHKIVCRKPAGTIALGRPSYSHMIALTLARGPWDAPDRSPDVLPSAGAMPWSRAIGVTACEVACRYLMAHTPTRTIVDPFCGRGTVLAVANALGLDAIGVEIGAKRCRTSRALVVSLEASR
jgi:DNA methylase